MAIALAACLIVGCEEKPKETEVPEEKININLLVSTGGDSLRTGYITKEIEKLEETNEQYNIEVTFVESDTMAFLKLLYSNGESYDIAGLSGESVVSAVKQNLVAPLDDFIMRDYGLEWMNKMPEIFMENTSWKGKIYAIPFVKSRLAYYERKGSDGDKTNSQPQALTIWEVMDRASETNKLSLPVGIIIKDLLLSRKAGSWVLEKEVIPYKVDTMKNEEFLRIIEKKRQTEILFEENYEKEIENFIDGQVNGLILDETYENRLNAGNTQQSWNKYGVRIDNSVPWLVQGYNLYLVNKPDSQNYENAWEVMKYLTDSQNLLYKEWENKEKEDRIYYRRISSEYNTKIQLMTDRMISEFFHNSQETEEMLLGLQKEIENILKPE